jgi:hypothetical protein
VHTKTDRGQADAINRGFAHVPDAEIMQAVGVAQIARDTKLTRQTIYRIKDDPAGKSGVIGLGAVGP